MRRPVQLVLVDLDNVWRQVLRERGPLPEPARGPADTDTWLESTGAPPPIEPANPPCVVVLAMNLDTAAVPELDFGPLRSFGERLARVLGRTELAGLELALTLPTEQSADKALERLLGSAPRAEHAGRLARVCLLSEDRGLRRALEGQLDAGYRMQKHPDGFSFSWTQENPKKKGLQRHPPGNPRLSLAVASPAPSDRAQALDTPEFVAWAQGRPVDVEPGVSLPQLVERIRRRPGLLTQVGLTLTSLRGLVRMELVAQGQPAQLGPCGPGDGLELCGEDVRQGHYGRPAMSSLGPGAIRLEHPRRATVRTRLPLAVVMAVQDQLAVDGLAAVKDALALTKVSHRKLASSLPFEVRLELKRSELKAEIVGSFGVPPPVWWLRDLKSRSKHAVRVASGSNVSLTVDAIPAVAFDGQARLVIVRAPCEGVVSAAIDGPSNPGAICAGRVGTHRVAVLERQDRPTPSASARCRAIQELSDTALRAAYPALFKDLGTLRQLPLMVPV